MKAKTELLRLKRHKRIKVRLHGRSDRPRMVMRRSLKNIYAQLVDDGMAKTIVSSSTMDKEVKQAASYGGNVKAAQLLGEVFGRRIKEKGINRIVFDRAGYLYHGRVKAFAEGLRKAGLEF